MSSDKKTIWNQYYEKTPFARGKAPSEFLVKMVSRLRKGKTLDIAMGEGQGAVYLAQKGFDVHGIDLSDVAVSRALQLAQETGVTIQAKTVDLDLFLFNLFEYDTVIMSFFKPSIPRYYSEIIRTMKQGGTLLVEACTLEEVRHATGDVTTILENVFKPNEILHQFKGLQILFYNEEEINGHHYVQCLARKPLEKDAVKYGFDIASKQGDAPTKSAQQQLAESLFKKK